MELKTGISKILERGRSEPEAVRYHVPAESGGWSRVTWGELLERSRSIALYLSQEGIGVNAKVSVFATTRVEWAYCTAAIEACRAVFVPAYFSNTPDQTLHVVDHSDAEVLFTEMNLLPRVLERWRSYDKVRRVVVWDLANVEDLAPMAGNAGLTRGEVEQKVISLREVLEQGEALNLHLPGELERLLEERRDEDVAAIIYTSGTTGNPKGVQLTNRNLQVAAESWFNVLEHAFPPAGERRDILWLPVSHMSGWGILGQGTMFDYETWLSDPYRLLRILPEVRPSMLFSVPAYWEKLYTAATSVSDKPAQQHAELHRISGGALTFLLSGGAGLKREVKEFFMAAGIQMIEGYGLTECSPSLTMNRLDDYDFDSVGKPMPGVTLKLAEDGEILARGENVFSGYYKDPDATRQSFDDEGWFLTGDLGRWTDEGFLQILGRKKEIIVTSGGKNIGPTGIEARFVGSPLIEHVVLYGDERKFLTALITLNEAGVRGQITNLGKSSASLAELAGMDEVRSLVQGEVDRVNAGLASYETIKKFHLHPEPLSVEAGHLTPSLKLRRAKVWRAFGDKFDAMYSG